MHRNTNNKRSLSGQGLALRLASYFAGSRFAARYHLNKPAERIAYLSTKNGFKLISGIQKRKARTQATAQPKTTAQLSAPKNSSPLFDLSLSDEQQIIQNTLHTYAREVFRSQAFAADEQQQPAELFSGPFATQLSELGLNAFSVPEALGGGAQHYSPVTNAIIAETLAWGDMSLAYCALAPTAVANALVKWGSPEQKNTLLPRYLDDPLCISAIAVQEKQPLFNPHHLRTEAKKTKNGYRLNGQKTLVPFSGQAEHYLVAAMQKGRPGLFIVAGDHPALQFSNHNTMGMRAAGNGTLTINNAELPHEALLGGEAFLQRPDNYHEFIHAGQLHWCALAIGTCQAALDYVIPYCNERQAFGEPISHRQSVAFLIADIAIELESMRLLTWRAASLAEAGKPFIREAYLAHTLCSEKSMKIATDAVQLLGGHGFTKEHPVERWYRDLRVLACQTSGLHL